MKKSASSRLLALLAITAGLVFVPGCSDDSLGTFQPICLVYTPEGIVADGTVVARRAATSSCGFLDVDLVVTGVSDVLGARFTLNYPFAFARFDGITTSNSFLNTEGTRLIVNVESQNPPDGSVAIVVTRQGMGGAAPTGVTPTPDTNDLLLTLSFTQIAGVGSGALSFTDMSLENPGTPPVTIPGIEWFGGPLNVQ